MEKKFSALLRKTCISQLPVDDMKKMGDRYVVVIGKIKGELSFFLPKAFEEQRHQLEGLTQNPNGRRYIRTILSNVTEYSIEECGSTCYIGPLLVSHLGECGDRLDVCWDASEGCWTVRNKKVVQE